jgi:hypothetical protein
MRELSILSQIFVVLSMSLFYKIAIIMQKNLFRPVRLDTDPDRFNGLKKFWRKISCLGSFNIGSQNFFSIYTYLEHWTTFITRA